MPLTPCHWLHLQSYLQPSPLRPPRLSPDPRGSFTACSWIELPSPATGSPETPQQRSTRWKLRGDLICESKHSFNVRSHAPTKYMKHASVSVHPGLVEHLYGLGDSDIFFRDTKKTLKKTKTSVLLGLHGCCSAPCHRFFKGGQGTRCSMEGTDVIQTCVLNLHSF